MKFFLDLDKENNVIGYGSSSITSNSVEIELEESHPVFDCPGSFKFVDGELVSDISAVLRQQKDEKFKEMSKRCQSEILGYFMAPVDQQMYYFSFDYEAQSNFIGSMTMFSEGYITEVEWTAHINEKESIRIKLNKQQFITIAMLGFQHKDSKISKLRNVVEPKIEMASTSQEVEAVTWE